MSTVTIQGQQFEASRVSTEDKHKNGGFWITKTGHAVQGDTYPYERPWHFTRDGQVRSRDMRQVLGERLSLVHAAWAEHIATGVMPPCPPGVDPGFLDIWDGGCIESDCDVHPQRGVK